MVTRRQATQMYSTVRVGVVGLGNFARQQHIPNLFRMPGVEVVSFCDTDSSILETVGEQYRVEERYNSYSKMLAESSLDAIVVTVRDDLQAMMAREALELDLNVYVEKPLSPDPRVCKGVADCARRSQGHLAVGYNKRFSPMYAKAKEILSRYGPPQMLHLAMTDDAWRWARGYEPGHLLALDVCHHFDLVQWLSASLIETVVCRSSTPDNDAIIVTTASGCVATIMFSGSDSMDAPKEYAKIIGEHFSLVGEDYVELFVHGLVDEPASYRFEGHIQTGKPFLHRRLMKKQGIAGWRDIRRIAWELYGETATPHGGATSTTNRLETPFIPNFIRDQGWYGSLYSFLTRRNDNSGHAGPEDATSVARITAAALRSRRNGTIETVRSGSEG